MTVRPGPSGDEPQRRPDLLVDGRDDVPVRRAPRWLTVLLAVVALPAVLLWSAQGLGGGGRPGAAPPSAAPTAAPVDVPAASAALGRLFVSECDPDVVYRVRTDRGLSRFAGPPAVERVGADQPSATAATRDCPWGLMFDTLGVVHVENAAHPHLHTVGDDGVARPLSGSAGGPVNGPPDTRWLRLRALLRSHDAVARGADGTVYVGDALNTRVRALAAGGVVALVTGASEDQLSAARMFDQEPAQRAQIAVDGRALYFNDTNRNRILQVDRSGQVTVLAGTGEAASRGDGGPAASAALDDPRGLAVDRRGRLYVSEAAGRRIRRIDEHGTITTVAGTGAPGRSGDGGLATQATFRRPGDVAVDPQGDVFVVDTGAGVVRRILPDGTITTLGE